MNVPIGFRDANAQIRQAQLQLRRQVALLHDEEAQAVLALQASYRQLIQAYELAPILAARRKAAATEYQARSEEFRAHPKDVDPDLLARLFLQAQSRWVDALRDEQRAVFAYNIALADFERQRGTILQYDHVAIADGPLPVCVQKRASEHIRQRQLALVLRERAGVHPEGQGCGSGAAPFGPAAPPDLKAVEQPPQLAALVEGRPGEADEPPPSAPPDKRVPPGTRDLALEFVGDFRRSYEQWKLYHLAAWDQLATNSTP
jgi:hypothetical protein